MAKRTTKRQGKSAKEGIVLKKETYTLEEADYVFDGINSVVKNLGLS